MVSVLQACTTLICLREVHQWQQPNIVNLLRSEAVDTQEWEEYVALPEAIEYVDRILTMFI
jgi:hypothetical protein